MNETLQVISNRRSTRAYQAEQITDSELQQILDAALLAPSALNFQKWHFTVVQNKDMLDRIVITIAEHMKKSGIEALVKRAGNPEYHTFHHAPTVIIVSGDEESRYTQNDCSAAAQNILIAAESLNIGSCWIGSVRQLFTTEKADEFKKELGIPEGYVVVCALTLGYKVADNDPAPVRNKNVINYIR